MEPEGSFPHSQASATCPYPEPDQSNSCLLIPLPEDTIILSSPLSTGLPSGLFLSGLMTKTLCGPLLFLIRAKQAILCCKLNLKFYRSMALLPLGANLLSSSLLSKNLKIKIYRTLILPVVLYGCETWSLTLREEHRLRVFENRVLRRIFGPKRDGVTGDWRKLHNEELNDLYCSPNIVRVINREDWNGRDM